MPTLEDWILLVLVMLLNVNGYMRNRAIRRLERAIEKLQETGDDYRE